MLAVVAIPPPASFCPPVKLPRGWRISCSCRAARVSAGYSQLEVRKVTYRPPGTEQNLLNEISLTLREKSFGLIFGRSGSGKTTLLQLLAGLSEPTSGSICTQKYDDSGNPIGLSELLTSQRVGIVFQFPERYFLADTVLEEVTFGWPRQKADLLFKEQLALNLQNAFNSVGLETISLDEDPQSLSGGFKRRLALAIQLVQTPDLLLLDEPLAGLDWKARADVVNLLKDLKKHHTILVGTISTSGPLMENGNGGKFEGRSFASLKMLLDAMVFCHADSHIENPGKEKIWKTSIWRSMDIVLNFDW